MDVLIYLIPVALGLGLLGLFGFLWALKNGQFDDLEGEAARILFDDDLPQKPVQKDDQASSGSNAADGGKTR